MGTFRVILLGLCGFVLNLQLAINSFCTFKYKQSRNQVFRPLISWYIEVIGQSLNATFCEKRRTITMPSFFSSLKV